MLDLAEFERKKKNWSAVLRLGLAGTHTGSPQTEKNQNNKKLGITLSKDLGVKKHGEWNSGLKRPLMLQKIHQNSFFNRPFSLIKTKDVVSNKTNSFSRKRNLGNEFKEKRTNHKKEYQILESGSSSERPNLDIAISVLKNEQICEVSETKKSYYLSPRLVTLPVNGFLQGEDASLATNSRFPGKRMGTGEKSELLSRKSLMGTKEDLKRRMFKKG